MREETQRKGGGGWVARELRVSERRKRLERERTYQGESIAFSLFLLISTGVSSFPSICVARFVFTPLRLMHSLSGRTTRRTR